VNAEQWNALYPVGTLVFAYPGCRPEFSSDARRIVTRTRTEAKSVGLDRDGVVWVEDHGAYISLTHVDPVSESVWQAAKNAEETAAAVAAQGALPVPVGDQPQPLDREALRAAYIRALENAHQTHPCPVLADRSWSGCVHYDEAGRVVGVGSCHSERRADAVLAVRDAEMESLRAQVAELEAERHTTNEALTDAAETLRANRDRIAELEAAQSPAAQHYDKVPDPLDGCHWCACGNRWPCKHAEEAAS
jgi:hypothetical protein